MEREAEVTSRDGAHASRGAGAVATAGGT
jgi:hypothetical protein